MKYTVDKLCCNQLAEVFDIGLQFQQEVDSLRDAPDQATAIKNISNFIENDIGVVLALKDDTGAYVGMLIGVCMPDVFSGVMQSQELVWYVKPECRGGGILLVKEFEAWSLSKDAKYVAMCHMVDSMPKQVATVYRRLGYKQQDIIYRKEL